MSNIGSTPHDLNHVPGLIAQSSSGTRTDPMVELYADPTTHRLLVDAGTITASSPSVGLTGANAPTSADQIGFNSGGNLVAVSAGNPLPITGSLSITNPSTGSAVPATANYIAGNKAGNLTGLLIGSQTSANSLAVVIASDQASIPVAATLSAETTKVIGTVNLSAAQTITVTQATGTNLHMVIDSGTVTAVTAISNALPAGTNLMGKVGVDQTTPGTTNAVSIAQIGATTVAGTGVSGALAIGGPTASGSTIVSKPTTTGGRAGTTMPTKVADGQVVNTFLDVTGRIVTVMNAPRELVLPITRLVLTASTAETSLIAAVASTFNDILELVIVNTSATGCLVDFRDSTGGTIRHTLYVPPTDTRGVVFQVPTPQAGVNTVWTAQCGTSVSSIIITGKYIANK